MSIPKGQAPAYMAHMSLDERREHMRNLSKAAWAKYTPEERHALAVARGIKQRHSNAEARRTATNGTNGTNGQALIAAAAALVPPHRSRSASLNRRAELRLVLEMALKLLEET